MADHASVVASGSFQVPPHAIVIADNASQANAWNGAQNANATNAPQPMSWPMPLGASLAVGGALLLSAYAVDG